MAWPRSLCGLGALLLWFLGCSAQNATLKVGILQTFAQSYNYVATVVMADLDFKKHFNDSIRARFGPPILPIQNLHPDLRPQIITREVMGSSIVAAAATQELIVQYGVNVLIGDWITDPCESIGTCAAANLVPHIGAGTGDTLGSRIKYPMTFRAAAPGAHIYTVYWTYLQYFKFRRAVLLYSNDGFGMILNLVKDLAQQLGRGEAVESIPIFGNPPWTGELGKPIASKVLQSKSRVLCIAARLDAISGLQQIMVDYGLHAPRYLVLANAVVLASTVWSRNFTGFHIVTSYAWTRFVEFNEMRAKMTLEDITGAAAELGMVGWKPLPFMASFMNAHLGGGQLNLPISDPLTLGFCHILFSSIFIALNAINNMLNAGVAVSEIKGAALQKAIRAVNLQGVAGDYQFDTNQDSFSRLKVMDLVSFKSSPKPGGGEVLVPMFVDKIYLSLDHKITSNLPMLWPDGTTSVDPPVPYLACAPGTRLVLPAGTCPDCEKGRISMVFDADHCDKCPVGTYSSASRTECIKCRTGSVAAETGLEACTICPPGLFAASEGTSECQVCALGDFSDASGSSECITCSNALTTKNVGAKNASQCVCPRGTYRPVGGGACQACGEGLDCLTGSEAVDIPGPGEKVQPDKVFPKVLPGYYTEHKDPFSVYICLEETWCPGVAPESCSRNTVGIACGKCEFGFFRDTTGKCVQCSGAMKTRGLIFLIPWIGLPICMAMTGDEADVHIWHKAKYLFPPLLYTVLFFIQTMSSFSAMSVSMPSSTMSLASSFSFAVDYRSFVRPECAEFNNYTANFVSGLLAPSYFAIIFLGTYIFSYLMGWVCHPMFYRRWYIVMSFYGACFSTFFLSIATLTFNLFSCYPHPNGKESVRTASSVLCNEDEWNSLVAIGVIAILVYCVGSMTGMFLAIYKARLHYTAHKYRLATKFLFIRFRIGYAYWSILLLLKGLLVSLTTVFFADTVSQFMWISGVLLMYVPLCCVVMPWRSVWVSLSDIISHTALVYIFAMGGFFAIVDTEEKNRVSTRMLAVMGMTCFGFFVSMVYVAQLMWIQERKPARLQRKLEILTEEICASLARASHSPANFKHLLEVLPDYEILLFKNMLHIMERESGKKGALRATASTHSTLSHDLHVSKVVVGKEPQIVLV